MTVSPTTAWTDICSCNICIPHVHVDYAGGRVMQEQLPKAPAFGARTIMVDE
ncbi:MAG: hypothetical protein Q7U66_19020 [Methylobacter sp.]|nr:hypothetical protein [Methylobacter sp.]